MSIPFSRAPHIEGVGGPLHPSQAPNAALLIDFDNVTMGMRSDLSKELKTLLNSDVIRGKVTVQRAYADWRRYPQYIVPLSEASIDLIFAPAYGSSKKNATDIRMAIDGMELVFTRPEIGTYILLTGDSDFSSLVLKLKEYGKYVIGVGIQESSSDILVQNCDEYYSYTALSGLRKTDDGGGSQLDPWVLVERAIEQMSRRGDVMRSDRLKQVMLEIDPGFDEKGLGFNKFSRFLSEAGKKGLIQLQRMENGQYEIVPPKVAQRTDEKKAGSGAGERESRRPERSRNDRGRPSAESGRATETLAGRAPADASRATGEDRTASPSPSTGTTAAPPPSDVGPSAEDRDGLAAAYDLLRRAIGDLLEDQDSDAARDSDVKRRMLALDGSFDETKLGFPKFSRFLQRAQDHEIVEIRKGEGSHSEVALGTRSTPPVSVVEAVADAAIPAETGAKPEVGTKPETDAKVDFSAKVGTTGRASTAGRLRPRESTVGPRGRGGDDHPPLFEGQVVRRASSAGLGDQAAAPRGESAPAADGAVTTTSPVASDAFDPALLRLPTGSESVIQYLSNSYGGVGKKTAETLVEALGDRLFHVLQSEPSRIGELLPAARAEKVLEGWEADYGRRKERHLAGVASRSGGTVASGSPGDETIPSTPAESDSPRSNVAEATDLNGEPPAPRTGRTRRTRGGR